MNRVWTFALLVVIAVAVPSPGSAQTCGFTCTVGQYLESPEDTKMGFIASHAKTSRRSRNANVQACVEGLSDLQIRSIFETYVAKNPDTRFNRATGIYARAIGACDKSNMPEVPAEITTAEPAEPKAPEAAPVAPVEEAPAAPVEEAAPVAPVEESPAAPIEETAPEPADPRPEGQVESVTAEDSAPAPDEAAHEEPAKPATAETVREWVEAGDYIRGYVAALNMPESETRPYVEWAVANAGRLPGVFLFEVSLRLAREDPVSAMRWVFAGSLRSTFEAGVCSDRAAFEGQKVLVSRVRAAAAAAQHTGLGPKDIADAFAWARAWYADNPQAVSPEHGCVALVFVHDTARRQASGAAGHPPLVEVEILPESEWPAVDSQIRAMSEAEQREHEAAAEGAAEPGGGWNEQLMRETTPAAFRAEFADMGVPPHLLDRWFGSEPGERTIFDVFTAMVEDDLYTMVYGMVVQLPASASAGYKLWVESRTGKIPGAFLYEVSQRLLDSDPTAAVNWYYAGLLRTDYERRVCTDERVSEGFNMIAEAVRIDLHKKVGAVATAQVAPSIGWGIDWFRDHPMTISPHHGCHVLLAFRESGKALAAGKSVAEAEEAIAGISPNIDVVPQSTWGALREDVIKDAEEQKRLYEAKAQGQ